MVSSLNNQPSVQAGPKFVFGIDGSIKNAIHIYDEKKLVYVAGHNVVMMDLVTRQ